MMECYMGVIGEVKKNTEADGNRIALVSEERSITYKELFSMSGKYKQLVLNHTKGKKEIIGVCFSRGVEYVCCILGILRAGCGFMPMAEQDHAAKIKHMLQISDAGYIISDRIRDGWPDQDETTVEILQGAAADVMALEETDQDVAVGKDDAAYLLFTSGTTGVPKGVMIHNEALDNFLDHILDSRILGEKALCLANAAFTFDISIMEIFYPLVNHFTCYVVGEAQQANPRKLAGVLKKYAFDFVQLTPSHLLMLMYADSSLTCLAHVKVLFVGGEKLPLSLLRLLQKQEGMKIFNVYGPTETTIWASRGDVTDSDYVHVGTQLENLELCILNADYEPAEEGELFVSGPGVAHGYWNNEKATRERFLKLQGRVYYRTGDYARLQDGMIVIAGRADNQIKLRGHRIELEEVECGLMNCRGIRQCVVLELWGRLLACYIPEHPGYAENGFRDEAKTYLDEHMIPDLFMRYDSFPLTASGKADRKQMKERIKRTMELEEKIINSVNEFSVRSYEPKQTLEELGVDSIEFISLLVKLEKVFKIEFDDEALLLSHYKCAGDFVEYVKASVQSQEQI